jgi:hypothetical protein
VTDTTNYIVTELLGKTLKHLLKDRNDSAGDGSGRPFSLETVCLVGLQLVRDSLLRSWDMFYIVREAGEPSQHRLSAFGSKAG